MIQTVSIGKEDALIIVDLQVDFCPGGNLAVPEGDEIVPIANKLVELFEKQGGQIVFSRDWHPDKHMSFKEYGGPWPVHCVQNTKGAEFHPDLFIPPSAIVVSKATETLKEAYSAFDGTGLSETLHEAGIERVFICGLATDVCVKSTALDAIKLGYDTYVIEDASRGISKESVEKSLKEMESVGVKIIEGCQILTN
ncbi:nicotinamidase [Acetomicrobium sp.]|jgi:nicotinamidase/pyrazinamidase|nr:nicotinamidase [Acetomicrobium sp.]